jgi:hypothetical protein
VAVVAAADTDVVAVAVPAATPDAEAQVGAAEVEAAEAEGVAARQLAVAMKAGEAEEPRPGEEGAVAAARPVEAARERRLPVPEPTAGSTDTLFSTAVHLSRNAGKPS